MKRYFEKLSGFKKSIDPFLTVTDDVGPSSEPATSTSTITTSKASTDFMHPVPSSAAIASLKAIQSPGVTTVHERRVSPPLAIAPAAHLDVNSPSLPDSIMKSNVGSERNSSFFPNARNILIAGGTFINTENYIVSVSTGEEPMKIPIPEKPNPTPFFTGREDVLGKLEEIFFLHANDIPMSRRSCLLWGMGGIGKTQICLKFIEEMSSSFTHVFWVDASSRDSIILCLKGICNIPAAKAFGVDGSVESALKWISRIQEEWLMVFDNADEPPPGEFIPPGDRGGILITSQNQFMGRVVSFENSIEIKEMEELDAVTLLLRASYLDHSAEHLKAAQKIVIELGCIPLAIDHAGACIEAGRCDINTFLRQLSLHRKTLEIERT